MCVTCQDMGGMSPPGLCSLAVSGERECDGAGGPGQSENGWVGRLHSLLMGVWLLEAGVCFNSAFLDFQRLINQGIEERK